jgi:23S rRNA (cytosine1962-C5)-methyltransferase
VNHPPPHFAPAEFPAHRVLDSGHGQKLERFGPVVLRRPDPQALWRPRLPPEHWAAADLCFVRESDRGGRWERGERSSGAAPPERWPLDFALASGAAATLWVEPSPFKHVGLFPEQACNWAWLAELRPRLGPRPALLNLFGYSGAASVVAALAGYEVTHVDASRLALEACRRNAESSGLGSKPFRLLLEDALSFAQREARRGARYAAVLLDPPHYGRGPKGQKWELEQGLAPLLEAAAELLEPRALLLLSTYAVGYSPLAFQNCLLELAGGSCAVGELVLPEGDGARLLPCGFAARWTRGLDP